MRSKRGYHWAPKPNFAATNKPGEMMRVAWRHVRVRFYPRKIHFTTQSKVSKNYIQKYVKRNRAGFRILKIFYNVIGQKFRGTTLEISRFGLNNRVLKFSTYISTYSNFSNEQKLLEHGRQNFSRWGKYARLDDFGTCRAVNKHGASTVVFGGDGIRQIEHVQWTRSSTVCCEYERRACCMTDCYESAINYYEHSRKVVISAKASSRGPHSTLGDKIENRERRRRERGKFDVYNACLRRFWKFRVKNGENCISF